MRLMYSMNVATGWIKKSLPICLLASIQAWADLPSNIQAKLTEAHIEPSAVGVLVEPMDKSVTGYQIHHQIDDVKTPASTQKLVSTIAALDNMGADYRWTTTIYQHGVVVGGVLYGDVVIVASGDPAMTYGQLRNLLSALKEKGVWHITGDIIIDDRVFGNVAFDTGAFDGQSSRAYNASPHAFLVNFGTIEVEITPAIGESRALVQVSPTLADFESPSSIAASSGECNRANEPKLALSKSQLSLHGAISNQCAKNSKWLAFGDSSEFAIKAVKGEWQKLDPTFAGKVRFIDEQFDADKLAEQQAKFPIVRHFSKSLAEQVYDINQFSNNVMTEQVALSLPLFAGATRSDYTQAFAFINDWWQKKIDGKPPKMSRASGLCRDCQISPASMASLLRYAYQSEVFEPLLASLPVVGQTGTMAAFAKRHPDSPAIGRAWLKTGTLNDVASVAGYAKDGADNWYVVVVFVNAQNAGINGHGLSIIDEVIKEIAVFGKSSSPANIQQPSTNVSEKSS